MFVMNVIKKIMKILIAAFLAFWFSFGTKQNHLHHEQLCRLQYYRELHL